MLSTVHSIEVGIITETGLKHGTFEEQQLKNNPVHRCRLVQKTQTRVPHATPCPRRTRTGPCVTHLRTLFSLHLLHRGAESQRTRLAAAALRDPGGVGTGQEPLLHSEERQEDHEEGEGAGHTDRQPRLLPEKIHFQLVLIFLEPLPPSSADQVAKRSMITLALYHNNQMQNRVLALVQMCHSCYRSTLAWLVSFHLLYLLSVMRPASGC